jgi:hypothetical protein
MGLSVGNDYKDNAVSMKGNRETAANDTEYCWCIDEIHFLKINC